MKHGSLEVICGPMFSGKTTELQRIVRRDRLAKRKVLVVKPDIDTRYPGVTSHVGLVEDATVLPTSLSTVFNAWNEARAETVAFDEAQFFESPIVKAVVVLVNQGVKVIVAGLDTDYRGEPFGSVPQLLALADHVRKLSAVCMCCGAEATRTQRLSASATQVVVGNQYEARCRGCWLP